MAEMTINRDPYIGDLYEVKYWHDGQMMGYLQRPREILSVLHDGSNRLDVQFVHFVGGMRPKRTYRRAAKRAIYGSRRA